MILRSVGGGLFGRTDHLWSPRLAIMLKPSHRLSVYASYTRSYLPQSGDQFSGLTSVTEGLKPERFDNDELGAKLQLPGGLLATFALYRLDRTNTRAADPANPALTVLTGAQRSRGIELGLERHVASAWLISGGYALQNAIITSTTTSATAGREVPLIPTPQRLAVEPLPRFQQTHRRRTRDDCAIEILCDHQQCGEEIARLYPTRRRPLRRDCRLRHWMRSSMSKTCRARTISRLPTPTTTSPQARRAQ